LSEKEASVYITLLSFDKAVVAFYINKGKNEKDDNICRIGIIKEKRVN